MIALPVPVRSVVCYTPLRILTAKTDLQIKLKRLQRYEYAHLVHWYIKSTIYKRFLYQN